MRVGRISFIAASGAIAAAIVIVVVATGSGPFAAPPTASPSTAAGASGPAGPVASGSSALGQGVSGATASPTPSQAPAAKPVPAGPFAGDLMIADRQNGRILIVDSARRIVWRFPGPHSLAPGERFAADDAFISPDGRTITANEEMHEIVVRIDLATKRIVWRYGRYDHPGAGTGELHTPDDAYPLANGDVVVADIENCRILEISPAKSIVHQWGRTGVCTDRAPGTFGRPNGDTPLPDGGLLVTEIRGSRVVRLDAHGHVVFDIHVPTSYPSDAQLLPNGDVLVVDYASPGAIVEVSPRGRLVWRYGPSSGAGRLDHPSLAMRLANGDIAVNDDFRHRVVIIDPRTSRIIWQYGHTDRHGTAPGSLFTPDGLDPIPPAVAAAL